MNKIQKQAARDAHEYARAQMFYGPGAGNRRKLITAAVAAKADRDPLYNRAFTKALAAEDMAAHAAAARKERRRKDIVQKVNKNSKDIAAGRYAGVNVAVLFIGASAYVAHKTGYDKVVVSKVKAKYEVFREKHYARRTVQSVDATIHRITDHHRVPEQRQPVDHEVNDRM